MMTTTTYVSPRVAADTCGLDIRAVRKLARENAIRWCVTDYRELRVSLADVASLTRRAS